MTVLGREICYRCRWPKRRRQWLCHKCERMVRRLINRKRKEPKR